MRVSSGLRPREANHQPLTPVTFLWRAAASHPDKVAVIDGNERLTYREFEQFTRRMAGMLEQTGVVPGDIVSVLAPSCIAMLAAHFAVPMTGAALNTINTRLDAETIAFMLRHGGARALITDREFSATIEAALALLDERPLVIDIDDPSFVGGKTVGEIGYEAFLADRKSTRLNSSHRR